MKCTQHRRCLLSVSVWVGGREGCVSVNKRVVCVCVRGEGNVVQVCVRVCGVCVGKWVWRGVGVYEWVWAGGCRGTNRVM